MKGRSKRRTRAQEGPSDPCALESIYCSFPPPAPRIDWSESPLAKWIINQGWRRVVPFASMTTAEAKRARRRSAANLPGGRVPRTTAP